MNRHWDPNLDRLDVRLEAPDQARYRLVEARWQGQAEAGDKHHIYVRVLDENGAPLQDHPFRVSNGGVILERTKGPGFDDFYGNHPMFAGGSYTVDIPDGASERVVNLHIGTPANAYTNACFFLVFQRGAVIAVPEPEPPKPEPPKPEPPKPEPPKPEPPKPEPPKPEPPKPEPPKPEPPAPRPALDAATRAQLLKLLDQAQAELDAARALLEEAP